MRKFLKPTKVSLLLAVVLAGALALTGCGNGGGGGGGTATTDFTIVVVGAGAAGMPAALAASDALGADGTVLLIEADAMVGGALLTAAGGFNGPIALANADGNILMAAGTTLGTQSGRLGANRQQAPESAFPGTQNFDKLVRIAAFSNHVLTNRFGLATPGVAGPSSGSWNVPMFLDGANHRFLTPGTNVNPGTFNGPLGAEAMRLAIVARHPTTGTHTNTDLRNLTLMTSTRGYELITDNGAVIGVVAHQGANTLRIYAEHVILATGGFLANNEFMVQHLDWTTNFSQNRLDAAVMTPVPEYAARLNPPGLRTLLEGNWYRGVVPRFHDGHGMVMANAAGAAWAELWTPGLAWDVAGFDMDFVASRIPTEIQPAFRGLGGFNQPIGLQPYQAIIVNALGERIVNEAPAANPLRFAFGNTFGGAMMWDGNYPFHVVFASRDGWTFTPPGGTQIDLTLALTTAAGLPNQSEVVMAETLEDLAEAMGIYVDGFLAQIERYNDFAAAAALAAPEAPSVDTEFRKANAHLVAFDEDVNGPFFAVRIYPGALLGFGGVRADWRGRALRANGSYIPGLYAVGEMSFRDMYDDGYAGGSAINLSITSGFIAGLDAAMLALGLGNVPTLVSNDDGFNAGFDPANPRGNN